MGKNFRHPNFSQQFETLERSFYLDVPARNSTDVFVAYITFLWVSKPQHCFPMVDILRFRSTAVIFEGSRFFGGQMVIFMIIFGPCRLEVLNVLRNQKNTTNYVNWYVSIVWEDLLNFCKLLHKQNFSAGSFYLQKGKSFKCSFFLDSIVLSTALGLVAYSKESVSSQKTNSYLRDNRFWFSRVLPAGWFSKKKIFVTSLEFFPLLPIFFSFQMEVFWLKVLEIWVVAGSRNCLCV